MLKHSGPLLGEAHSWLKELFDWTFSMCDPPWGVFAPHTICQHLDCEAFLHQAQLKTHLCVMAKSFLSTQLSRVQSKALNHCQPEPSIHCLFPSTCCRTSGFATGCTRSDPNPTSLHSFTQIPSISCPAHLCWCCWLHGTAAAAQKQMYPLCALALETGFRWSAARPISSRPFLQQLCVFFRESVQSVSTGHTWLPMFPACTSQAGI